MYSTYIHSIDLQIVNNSDRKQERESEYLLGFRQLGVSIRIAAAVAGGLRLSLGREQNLELHLQLALMCERMLCARLQTVHRQTYSCVDELAVVVVARPEATQTLRLEQVDGRRRLHFLEHHL